MKLSKLQKKILVTLNREEEALAKGRPICNPQEVVAFGNRIEMFNLMKRLAILEKFWGRLGVTSP